MSRDAVTLDPALIKSGRVRSILVCQLRQIGDVLLATPSISLLRRRFPEAAIHVLTEKKCAPVLEHNPDIATIWALDKKQLTHPGKDLAFAWGIARQRFDILVDFQQLPRIRWVAALSRLFGTRVRLTHEPPWYNRWLYTHWVRPRDGYAAMSKASVLEPLGIAWDNGRPSMVLTDQERERAEAACRGLGIGPEHVLITVDPTHRRETRRWPAGHFGRAVALAAEKRPELRFVVLWGPGEQGIADEVRSAAKTDACIVPESMIGIRDMAAVIQRAALHFGTCSLPRHVAVAVGTPTLVVLGSTSPAWTCPGDDHQDISLGLDCQPCNKNTCEHMRCLLDLEPEQVATTLLERLETAP